MNPAVLAVAESLGHKVTAMRPVAGGSICDAWQLDTTTGTCFAKVAREPSPGMFTLEAAGLSWLADAGVRTPRVIAATEEILLLEWIIQEAPTSNTAHLLGTELAQLHATAAPSFGSPPANTQAERGWVGSLPMPLGHWDSWPEFYALARLEPTMSAARGAHNLDPEDARLVDRVCDELLGTPKRLAGPDLAARRIHGDLWSGNILWSSAGATLIDPAAHGGHPETDLAMLQLFGAPMFDQIRAGYQATAPLAAGWQDRVALHQLFPVLVHAALFGGGYGSQAGDLAAQILSET